jgi:hypothetical protein
MGKNMGKANGKDIRDNISVVGSIINRKEKANY